MTTTHPSTPPTAMPPFIEHRIEHGEGRILAREFPGAAPAFVLMHGFPDNSHIYDDLIPCLVAAGRHVVAFDFLGFGASDKLPGATYSFAQQFGDLLAVVDALHLGKVVPVAHDSSGPAAINFAIDHPDRVASLCLLNSAYDDAFPVLWPEMITLFATGSLAALGLAIAQDPAQFGWLLTWQQAKFSAALPPDQRAHFQTGMGKLIADNFIRQPGSGPAFLQMASGFVAELARNTTRLPQVKALDVPVKVIWGEFDPYITADVARDRAARFANASLQILPGGHWIQADLPAQVAEAMLS